MRARCFRPPTGAAAGSTAPYPVHGPARGSRICFGSDSPIPNRMDRGRARHGVPYCGQWIYVGRTGRRRERGYSGCPFPIPCTAGPAVKKAPSCISKSRNNASLSQLAQPGLQDSDCCNSGSFGSQDSGSQGDSDNALFKHCDGNSSSSQPPSGPISNHTSPLLCNGKLLREAPSDRSAKRIFNAAVFDVDSTWETVAGSSMTGTDQRSDCWAASSAMRCHRAS